MKYSLLLLATLVGLLAFGCSDDSDGGMVINSVNPNAGKAGESVTIAGENFGSSAADITVRFGPATAEVSSVTDQQIVAVIPATAPIGGTTIQVIKDGETQTIDFTINDPIVGTWVSEGSNISPLLAAAPFNTVRIDASFNSDGTYTVVTTDNSDSQVTLSGTWETAEGSGDIREITVNQSSPTSLVSEGIYRFDGSVLRYEIAQTNPPLTGVTPPTAAGGFGSTSGGAFGQLNVQQYVPAN